MKRVLLFLLLLALTACAPTATVQPALAPTDTPVPTATVAFTPTPVPDGPCDNPLLPLTPGSVWTYRVTTESGETFYTLKVLDRNDGANIVVRVEFTNQKTGAATIEPVVCLEGAIEDFPLFALDMHFSNYLARSFNTYHDSGLYAPDYQTLAGKDWSVAWDAKYLTEDYANIKNLMGGSDIVVAQSSFIDLAFEMNGTREAVSAPAGEYSQALKVVQRVSFPVTLTLPTGGTGGILTLHTSQWYEPYVGLVRAQTERAALKLNQQEIVIPVLNLIELTEFVKGGG
ncbi:MAG: hypothetical protein LDL50_05845 [Chloroflexi bacterium]|nr:hypothetical protein [Chloroflexota bacterium]